MHYRTTNHLLHAILSVLTFGLWIPVWLVIALTDASHNRAIDRRIALATLMSQATIVDEEGNPVAVRIDASGDLHVLGSLEDFEDFEDFEEFEEFEEDTE